MSDSENAKSTEEKKCPFCSSSNYCEHLLLMVDTTFRVAEGGILMELFNKRWHSILENYDDDFDEYEPFNNLIDEVDSFADFQKNHDHEGGPGMSSSYVSFFAESKNKAHEILSHFENIS